MAEKQNIGGTMFERAGRAMGSAALSEEGYEAPIDHLKYIKEGATFTKQIQNKIKANKEKDKDLLKDFPNGINVLKVPESFQEELKNWLVGKREDYAVAAEIIAKGKDDPAYYDAVDKQNLIKEQYEAMSAQLEGGATMRKNILDRQRAEEDKVNSGRSAAMTNFQDTNFSNIAQENYGVDGLNLRIDPDTNDLVVTDAEGKTIKWSDLDSGKGYDAALANTINAFSDEIVTLAHSDNPNLYKSLHYDRIEKQIRTGLEQNPKAVIEAMFNEPDFEDERDRYIAQQMGMEYGSNEFLAFKKGEPGTDVFTQKYTKEEAMDLKPEQAINELVDAMVKTLDKDPGEMYEKYEKMYNEDRAGFINALLQLEDKESYLSVMEDMKTGNINNDVFMSYVMESFDTTFDNTLELIDEHEVSTIKLGKGKSEYDASIYG